MHRLFLMPQGSIHVDILKDNISAAQQHPECGNCAAGVMKQYTGLIMLSPFSSSGITALDSLGFQANMEGQHRKVWNGLHVSPRLAPSKEAKLCTNLHGSFAQANCVSSRILTFPCLFPGCGC